MIARKQYVAMVMVFLTVFLLFQGLQVSKTLFIDTESNPFRTETGLGAGDAWGTRKEPDGSGAGDARGTHGEPDGSGAAAFSEAPRKRTYCLFVGDSGSACAKTTEEWALYTKRTLLFSDTLPEPTAIPLPELLLMDRERIAGSAPLIQRYLDAGVDVIFTSLPESAVLADSPLLRELLGVRAIREQQLKLLGVRLFSGFLLGGERLYVSGEQVGEQDLALDSAWYIVRQGTETYVQGILHESDRLQAIADGLENEDLPALIWRSHAGNAELFAVNGAYLEDRSLGIGILDALMAKRSRCELYPVVNAQLFSLASFPLTADENSEAMMQIYGKTLIRAEEDTILPMLFSAMTKYGARPGFFMAPQYMFSDDAPAQDGVTAYFLRYLQELGGELGLSLLRGAAISATQALIAAEARLHSESTVYPISALLCPAEELLEAVESAARLDFRSLATIVTKPDEELPLLGFAAETVTVQQFTDHLTRHSFADDFSMLGLETALGYRHAWYDMSSIAWPQTQEDQWQLVSQTIFSNLSTFQTPFSAFDWVTASECDARIRRFLSLDYVYSYEDGQVELWIDGFQQEAYFILRTRGEDVEAMEGGDWTQIEQDAWLIHASDAHVSITLSSSLKEKLLLKEGG